MPGGSAAAKQKPMPASCDARGRLVGGPGRGGRRAASSRSAAPAGEEAERLPCLTTVTPAPAATIAAMVEMLTVMARSPPVPTTSTAASRPATVERRSARGVHRLDQPAISAEVSPLARSATANPAIWAGRGLAGHDLAHRPGGLVGGEVARRGAGTPSTSGQVARRHHRSSGWSGDPRAQQADTVSRVLDRVQRVRDGASARDQVASQLSCGAADQHQDRRAVGRSRP